MKRQSKKYEGPHHPWRLERIQEENKLSTEYGLRNKKEIYRMQAHLRSWRDQAKVIASLIGDKKTAAEKILVEKLQRLGVLKEAATVDDVLSLTVRDVLEKRLQTIVYKKGFAVTANQARQFIVHRKIQVNGEKIDAPSYLVKARDEVTFISGFNPVVAREMKLREEQAKGEQEK